MLNNSKNANVTILSEGLIEEEVFMTHIFTILTITLSVFISGISYNRPEVNQENFYIQGEKEKMPKFSYHTLNGKKFSNRNLEPDKTYLFVYFNPLCDLCKEEIEDITDNIGNLEDVQILLVSPNQLNEIEQFSESFGLDKFSQITILHDFDDTFYLEFGAIGYPNLYIYNSNKELVRYFDHATGFLEIKNAITPVLTQN